LKQNGKRVRVWRAKRELLHGETHIRANEDMRTSVIDNTRLCAVIAKIFIPPQRSPFLFGQCFVREIVARFFRNDLQILVMN
jgi:hypothetical protein